MSLVATLHTAILSPLKSNYSVLIVLFVGNSNEMKHKQWQGKTEEMFRDCAKFNRWNLNPSFREKDMLVIVLHPHINYF